MPELAQKLEPEKEIRSDSDHEEAPAVDQQSPDGQQQTTTPVKRAANRKAGDAASKRMAGPGQATDQEDPQKSVVQPGDSREVLESKAGELEAQVMDMARALGKVEDPAAGAQMQGQLQIKFDQWKAAIDALIKMGALDSVRVKSFTAKTEQASLIQANLAAQAKQGDPQKYGKAYADHAKGEVAKVSVATKGQTADRVMDANPLLGVGPLAQGPTLQGAKDKGSTTTHAQIGAKKDGSDKKDFEVRQDVCMVFCPGVARTGSEFGPQMEEAAKMGIGSTRAETGSFMDPDQNAEAVAGACRQAQQMTGNANVKMILVGYSQGNTNIFAFMRDKDGKYADLRKNVIAIHDMHSAAGGSQLADLAMTLGQYFCTDQPLDENQQLLLGAYERAQAKALGIDQVPKVAAAVTQLHDWFSEIRHGIDRFHGMIEPVLQKIGLGGLSGPALGKKLFQLAINGEKWTDEIAQMGWAGKAAAKVLNPIWDSILHAATSNLATDSSLGPMIGLYLAGRLESLTTKYCHDLMSDPLLAQHLAGVMIINSVGAVPQAREQTLVPKSQRLGYEFFNQLGMDSDYQVSVQNQKLEGKVANAVDCAPEAIGHWGVAGVTVPVDHGPEYFKDFSPGGLTRAALTTYAALGLI